MNFALICATVLFAAACIVRPVAAEGDSELVANSDFSGMGEGGAAGSWTTWHPEWGTAECTVKRTGGGLLVDAPGKPFAVGGVSQRIAGVKPGQAYAVTARCQLTEVEFPYQTVMVRLEWLQGDKQLHPAGRLVSGPTVESTTGTFHDVLVAPDNADGARLTLEVKWPRGGSVVWKRVSMRPTEAAKPRKAKVGTVYLIPRNSTPEKNLDLWCEQIEAAGKLGLDIVCLGEAILAVGTGAPLKERAAPIPGPYTERLGEVAKRNRIWVVAGLTELDGDAIYNTAVLLNRDGNLAGKYRKIHLPREEWRKGITPGDEYPVFRTDFGTIAIQICYDWFFPEPEAIFAQKGAEIIFAPTWGNTRPDHDGMVDGENTFRVRARDNGVYMVPSVYSGNSLVIDPLGRILASSDGEQGVVWAAIDLGQREALEWVGHWRAIGPRDRMPHTYRPLTGMQEKPNY